MFGLINQRRKIFAQKIFHFLLRQGKGKKLSSHRILHQQRFLHRFLSIVFTFFVSFFFLLEPKNCLLMFRSLFSTEKYRKTGTICFVVKQIDAILSRSRDQRKLSKYCRFRQMMPFVHSPVTSSRQKGTKRNHNEIKSIATCLVVRKNQAQARQNK